MFTLCLLTLWLASCGSAGNGAGREGLSPGQAGNGQEADNASGQPGQGSASSGAQGSPLGEGGADPGAENAEAGADAQAGSGADAQAGAGSDVQSGAQAGAGADARTGAGADAQAGAGAGAQAGAQGDAVAGAPADPSAAAASGTGADGGTSSESSESSETSESAEASEANAEKRWRYYIASDNTNLREGPSAEYARITSVTIGAAAYAIGLPDQEWQHVLFEGQEGYIKAEFLTPGYFLASIPPIYNQAGQFADGLAWVRIGDAQSGKSAFIDTTGRALTPFRYDSAADFSEGLARVEIGGLYGFVDTEGNEAVACIYSRADSFSDGMAMVGQSQTSPAKFGFINQWGRELVPLLYDDASAFADGMAKVQSGNNITNIRYGFVDKAGNVAVPLGKYRSLDSFSEGRAAIGVGAGTNLRYGYIDPSGYEVVPCRYSAAEPYADGVARVRMGAWDSGLWGYIDKNGREIIPLGKYGILPETDMDFNFSEGLAIVGIGAKGSDGAAYASQAIGFIDKNGELAIPYLYDWAYPFSEGLAAVSVGARHVLDGGINQASGGKWGFIDKSGEEIVPPKYDAVQSFSQGLAAVNYGIHWIEDEHNAYLGGGKWGFIDREGNELVPIIFDEVRPFGNGMASVRLGSRWGFISLESLGREPWEAPEEPTRSQSQIPFLGYEEIEDLFVAQKTIGDWVKALTSQDIDYDIRLEEATGELILSIYAQDRKIAELIFDGASEEVEELLYTGAYSTKTLEPYMWERQIKLVLYVDFAAMGLPFTLRGISIGSSAESVKEAFLDTKTSEDEMYNWKDVAPDAFIEHGVTFLGGIDEKAANPSQNHGLTRAIMYYHTMVFYDNDREVYSIYYGRTRINFAIDQSGQVASLIYQDMTHRN